MKNSNLLTAAFVCLMLIFMSMSLPNTLTVVRPEKPKSTILLNEGQIDQWPKWVRNGYQIKQGFAGSSGRVYLILEKY